MDSLKEILAAVTDLWTSQVKLCQDARDRDFGVIVDEIEEYAGKRYDSPWNRRVDKLGDAEDASPDDDYAAIVNYTQLFVDTITPYVFASVPNRLVRPDRQQISPELENEYPDISAMQRVLRQRDTMLADELQSVLSWLPKVYGLSREGEIAVRDALVGRGCLWLETVDSPSGEIPASIADSWRNLLIDADTRQLKDAAFIVRKRTQVAWKVAELWGEDVENVRGSRSSNQALAIATAIHNPDQAQSDLVEYFEFYSRIGLGQRLIGAPDEMQKAGPLQEALDAIGDFLHFAILPGLDHPLGMDPEKIEALSAQPQQLLDVLRAALEWPLKTYGNGKNPWPLVCFDLKPRNDKPWPKPLLELALPLQRFLDAIYRAMLRRAEKAGKDVVVTSLALEPEVLEAIKGLQDLVVVRSSEATARAVKELIDFISFPQMNEDVFRIREIADSIFRELTGLDENLLGATPRSQPRSAKQSSIQSAGISRRPDDYADKVEAFMSEVANAESIVARQILEPAIIAHLFGETPLDATTGQPAEEDAAQVIYGPRTLFWINDIHTEDPWVAAAEWEYTVEAGSGRRRNKQLQQENAQQLYTMLGQQLFALGQSLGDMEPFLALVRMVGDAFDMPTEPVISKVRDAIAKAAGMQAAQGQPGQPGQPDPNAPPQGAGGGAPNLPPQYMTAAGGPHSLSQLPPPPGTT